VDLGFGVKADEGRIVGREIHPVRAVQKAGHPRHVAGHHGRQLQGQQEPHPKQTKPNQTKPNQEKKKQPKIKF
jgi:hypothetical protein